MAGFKTNLSGQRLLMQNREVVRNIARKHLTNVVTPKVMKSLTSVANSVISYVDNSSVEEIPLLTGNLRDSIGIGIYKGGVLSNMFYCNQIATKPQHYKYMGVKYSPIWGRELLVEALNNASSVYFDGVWIVLYAAVPYAPLVNRINTPFFRNINNMLKNGVKRVLVNTPHKLK